MNKSATDKDTEKRNKLARRIFDYLPHWERENTPAQIAENIKKNPLETIEFLLNELDSYM